MPTNLYGPQDNFDLASSHVLPALMRKFHDAKERGEARRHGVGHGPIAPRVPARRRPRRRVRVPDAPLRRNAAHQRRHRHRPDDRRAGRSRPGIVYPSARVVFDTSKPDGMPRKLLDVSRLHALGWKHTIDLADGIASTYRWFVANHVST